MSDLVSREELLHAIDEKYPPRVLTPSESVIVSWVYEMIQAFPSAEPKHGKWIPYGENGRVRCSRCFSRYDWTSKAQFYDFCPKCGADMRENHE